MKANRFVSNPLLPFIFVIIAGASVWLAVRLNSSVWVWASVLSSIAAGVSVVFALRQRRAASPTAYSRAGWTRLIAFAVAGIVIAAVSTGVWLAHDRAYALVHPGRAPITRTPADVGMANYEAVSFKSPDGLTLKGWYAPTQNGAVVILVHGLGGARTDLLDDGALLAARGYGILAFDLRNSGESDGTVTTFGLLEVNDVRAAVDFVVALPGVDADRIGLMGHSMGGATAIMATARIPEIKAVVARSAYTSIEDNIGNGVESLTRLPSFPFAPLVVFFGQQQAGVDIRQVRPVDDIVTISPRPVLLVHGALDKTIPVANSYALYEAAKAPKELYIIENAGHGMLPQAGGEEYVRRVVGFFDRYLLER